MTHNHAPAMPRFEFTKNTFPNKKWRDFYWEFYANQPISSQHLTWIIYVKNEKRAVSTRFFLFLNSIFSGPILVNAFPMSYGSIAYGIPYDRSRESSLSLKKSRQSYLNLIFSIHQALFFIATGILPNAWKPNRVMYGTIIKLRISRKFPEVV